MRATSSAPAVSTRSDSSSSDSSVSSSDMPGQVTPTRTIFSRKARSMNAPRSPPYSPNAPRWSDASCRGSSAIEDHPLPHVQVGDVHRRTVEGGPTAGEADGDRAARHPHLDAFADQAPAVGQVRGRAGAGAAGLGDAGAALPHPQVDGVGTAGDGADQLDVDAVRVRRLDGRSDHGEVDGGQVLRIVEPRDEVRVA